MKVLLAILALGFSTNWAFSNCPSRFASKGFSSEEFKSIHDSNEEFREISKDGVMFSIYARGYSGFPFSQFQKGTALGIQEITHGGWGWTRLHTGTLQAAGNQYLILNINGKGKRFEIRDIAGVTLLRDGNIRDSSSEELKSIHDSNQEFRKLSKAGIMFSIYGAGDARFPFSQFPKGTEFAIQEITHGGWGWTKLHIGTLQAAGNQYLILNINGHGKRLEIRNISGITAFFHKF